MMLTLENIIKTDSFLSYPDTLVSLIKKNIEVFLPYINAASPRNKPDIASALESYQQFSNPLLKDFLDQYMAELELCVFEGYHACRVLSNDEITNNGLLVLEPVSYEKRMTNLFKDNGMRENEIVDAISAIRKWYNGRCGCRLNQICFFAPYSAIKAGYNNFAGNIGGEIAKRALKEGYPLVYSLLQTAGKPVVVKFAFNFSTVGKSRKEAIGFEILRFVLSEIILHYHYPVCFDGYLTEAVPPDKILNINNIQLS